MIQLYPDSPWAEMYMGEMDLNLGSPGNLPPDMVHAHRVTMGFLPENPPEGASLVHITLDIIYTFDELGQVCIQQINPHQIRNPVVDPLVKLGHV